MIRYRPVLVCLLAIGVPSHAFARPGPPIDDGRVARQDGATVAISQPAQEAGVTDPLVLPDRSTGIARPLDRIIADAALEAGVDGRLLQAIAWHESRFRQDVVSSRGAIGVMQLMPATAQALGVDPHDLVQNVRGGAALLGLLLRRFGAVDLALAAYSAGASAVLRHGGVPPIGETQAFVADIRRAVSF